MDFPTQDPRSVLMITLDSCRFDTFAAADCPQLKSIGPLVKGMAPASFTFASHMAMFVGFTPGDASRAEPFVNPKFAKIFKMAGLRFPGGTKEFFSLPGRSIIDGFNQLGYRTIGTGAVDWFNPSTPTGKVLSQDFHAFFYAGSFYLRRQMAWMHEQLSNLKSPTFAFINIGETHVPYYFEGAPWKPTNLCIPFNPGGTNDAIECLRRQTACLEFVDQEIAPLLRAFSNSTIFICGDHGDAWGEDGLWEHGIYHPKVLEVPVVYRLGERGLHSISGVTS